MRFDWSLEYVSRYQAVGPVCGVISIVIATVCWQVSTEYLLLNIFIGVFWLISVLGLVACKGLNQFCIAQAGSYILIDGCVFTYRKPAIDYAIEFPVADIEKIRVFDLWIFNALILNIKDQQYLSFYFHDVQTIRQHLQTLRPELSFR